MERSPHDRSPHDELHAIEELHRRDMEAARAGDVEVLSTLWSDDIVGLPPGGPIFRGKETALAGLRRWKASAHATETTEYVLDFEEVKVLGDFAFEWGTFRGAERARGGGPEVRQSGKLLRVLQRSPDGTWRVHRTIWNVDPPQDGAS
jgi:ketosteroid isomerase-like protein